MTRTLVLGGGGVTGVAWELGVLEGLRRSGLDFADADTVVGTSAGSVVGTHLTSGTLSRAYEEQLTGPGGEIPAKLGKTTLIKLVVMMARRIDEPTKLRKIGKAALAARTVPLADRMEVIRSRIGDPAWPAADLRITAVDIDLGELVLFDAGSGVSLLDAVAASCAVPMVWPPVPINGTTYVDGGARSPVNADRAGGAETLVVIAPMPDGVAKEHHLDAQLARTDARRTATVTPDKESVEAMGSNSLDPARRTPSAEAGLRQGLEASERIAAVWNA